MSSFFLVFFLFSLFLLPSLSQPQFPRGSRSIDCGTTAESEIEGRTWLPDYAFITAGMPKNLTTTQGLAPTLSTVRSFPLDQNVHKKFCYVVPAYHPARYLIRTTYFYGGVNGEDSPPVFDQIVDGTFWSVVNTTDDYAKNLASYYEGVFATTGSAISVCVAANIYTTSDPFISALEFVILGNTVYNSTDFTKFGLGLVARHSFGYSGSPIRFPDDEFDRYWQPFGESNSTLSTIKNLTVAGFWNRPPLKIFQTEMSSSLPNPLEIQWPPSSLPNATYYIALYFAEDSSRSSRAFDISINGIPYYSSLNVTPEGVAVFSTRWPLAGLTKLTLTPVTGSDIGPLINGGEAFSLLPLGGKTTTRDVIAMERLKGSLLNYPIDWNGDPCMPSLYSWTGVTCSEGSRIRVVTLNLTGMGISGSLSPYIANLTALTNIWLGNNSISGSIPDLTQLRRLEILHLEDNQLSGEIPQSLDSLPVLRELYLQNNNLTGQVPPSLLRKPGLLIRTSPGNHFSEPTPPPTPTPTQTPTPAPAPF